LGHWSFGQPEYLLFGWAKAIVAKTKPAHALARAENGPSTGITKTRQQFVTKNRLFGGCFWELRKRKSKAAKGL
jgi:hypothetical protein